ncbi:MAG TPA: hypothetical protein PKW90_29780, partial [Myxococcota bacterium]|nr:hypothetical protein [Myxococcota bacterium]
MVLAGTASGQRANDNPPLPTLDNGPGDGRPAAWELSEHLGVTPPWAPTLAATPPPRNSDPMDPANLEIK